MRLALLALCLVACGGEFSLDGIYNARATTPAGAPFAACADGSPFEGPLGLWEHGSAVHGLLLLCGGFYLVDGTLDDTERVKLTVRMGDDPLVIDALAAPGTLDGTMTGHGVERWPFLAQIPGTRTGKVPWDPLEGR